MRTLRWILLAVLVALACLWLLSRGPGKAAAPEQDAASSEPAAVESAPQRQPAAKPKPRRAGRRAVRPTPTWISAALEAMGEETETSCGPYRLLTDSADSRLADVCQRIGTALETDYRERIGLDLVGEPDGAVLIFARAADFRAFTSAVGTLGAGYAGFSRATRGIVALSAEGLEPGEVAPTLAHELTHLLNRRALGSGIPRWLSEGLADAVGDTATAEGLGPLRGFEGVETQRRRLREAYRSDRAGSLERLITLDPEDFDREVVSFDYEQSALVVRFLLLDPELAPRFRSLLARFAAGEPFLPERVTEELALDWEALERRFRAWLASDS